MCGRFTLVVDRRDAGELGSRQSLPHPCAGRPHLSADSPKLSLDGRPVCFSASSCPERTSGQRTAWPEPGAIEWPAWFDLQLRAQTAKAWQLFTHYPTHLQSLLGTHSHS